MGIKDFESMFDTIDLTRKGVVTADQLHKFCEQLYFEQVCIQHVQGAISRVCGSSGMVSRREFLDVLTEVERRRATEEQAYWDFQGLDYTGRNRISLRDALLLFREIHGEQFSLATWRRFLSSRDVADADVSFDEMRFWLCDIPAGSPCSDKELKEEENQMLMRQMQYETDMYDELRDTLDDDESRRRENDEHIENQTSHAKRKLNKWNHEGLEAMLFDDGLDVGDVKVKGRPKAHVTLSDLIELLEQKYEALQEKLMLEMARQASAVDEEIPEVLQKIRSQKKHLIKDGASYADQVPGGNHEMPASLTGLMGELRLYDREHRKQIDDMKLRLKEKGKSQHEIAFAVQERYEQIIRGDTSCAGIMIQLHKRHRQEREVLMSTLKIDTANPLNQAMVVEYARITRQLILLEEEKSFVAIATVVGLAERAMEPRIDRSDWDRSRSERLAQLRIEERAGKAVQKTPQDLPDKHFLEQLQFVDLQVELVREVTKKHFYERETLVHMMKSKECKEGVEKAKKLKTEDRKQHLKGLQSHHQAWKSNPRADNSVLRGILMEALCLRHEERRCDIESGSGSSISSEEMQEVLLADLQQRQGSEFEILLQDMQKMSQDKMILMFGKQCESRLEEHYDNIAIVVLGTTDISEEDEEYIKTLEDKYEILRKRMLLMSLKDQMDWRNLAKEDKQAALRDIIKQEKLFRSEGKLQEMEALLGPKAKAKILPALRFLIGEDKSEYHKRKQQQKHDEDRLDPSKVLNLLADLIPRYDCEREFLLSWLHSPEAKTLSLRMKRMRIVEIKTEACRVEMEEDFEIATLSIGLMERVKDTLTQRHDSDMERQRQLSRKRVQQRRLRLQQHEEFVKEPQVSKDNIPDEGDITGLQVVYLREMLKRHGDEREVMLYYLQDESLEDLMEAAATMSDDERQRRLIELQGKRHNLNLTVEDDRDEHVAILEEAAALRAASIREQLTSAATTNNMEAIAVVLLAELQEEQDREVALTLQHIENMNEEDIRTSLSREINNRKLENSWNVMTVFARYQGEVTDDLLLKALEDKYTVLRQKLLVDCIRIRMGTDQWQELSQNEQHQKVLALDYQAVEQIRMGQIMPSLLGEGFHLQESVTQLMGVCQHVFRNKVKGQQVIGNHSNLSMEEDSGAVRKKGEPVNPLQELYNRLEEERNALNRQLKGHTEDHFSESERQVQLTRYHREAALANQEEAFVVIATMVGLMERQQEEIKFRLMKDLARYQRLAKKVLADAEKGKQSSIALETPNTRSIIQHVDHILLLLQNKHVKEQELFCRLLGNSDKNSDMKEEAAMLSSQERRRKMTELRETRNKTVKDRKCENLEVLTEGTVYKKEARRIFLLEVMEQVTEDQLCESLMASLLEYQNSEAERLIKALSVKTDDGIATEEKRVTADTKSNMADNIALVVLSPDPTDSNTDDEVIEALQGKYDALKDKLLAEALMKELGESEWNRLSEKERQKKIFQLKMRERQLRKAGKIDEANALLAELLKEQEHLRQLMGDSVQDQRQRLLERLRKRKERLAQGMTQAEVDELERQEIKAEEEEERNRKRNALEDLEHRFKQEKEELLRRLGEAGDERERERQALLARLKRDQRLAEKEDNFDGAALILGLAEKRDRELRFAKDEERKRLEKLARERLEAAKKKKKGGDKEEPDLVIDTEDSVSLHDAIARNMDRRHRKERKMMIQLMEESINSKQRKAAKELSNEERSDRMFELNELYKNWSNSDDKNLKEQMELLRDAIGLMLELIRCESEADGQTVTEDDLQVKLLADLQEEQNKEAQRLLSDLENKDLQGLQQLHKAVTVLSKDGCYDNIAAVLLGDRSRSLIEDDAEDEGETSEASVLKALENKYDAMKEKLLLEVLIKEHGEVEWNRMTEKQRQKKLIDLKLKERKLRREGKLDEIANIIGTHLQNEKLLDDFIVENERKQRERLEARRARRKELKAEREAQGLPADDATVDAIVAEEEEQEMRQRRRNILEDLERNFDDEKAALLRLLAQHTDKVAVERQRQIELAKLKRDERRMRKGEKLNEVVLIIHSAKEQERKREEGVTWEMERQRMLARERLEARRQKKQGKQQTPDEMKKKLSEDEERLNLEEAVKDAEGRSVHEALLTTVEDKHKDEMDMLMALLELAKSGKQPDGKPDEELKSQLTRLEQDQGRWKKRSVQQVADLDESRMTQEQCEKHMADVAQNRSDQIKLLTEAMVYRLEVERRLMQQNEPDLSLDTQEEEVQVTIVTDLQEKQTAEARAIQSLLDKQDDDTLKELRRSQHIAWREGWFDNLTSTIFHVSHPVISVEEEDFVNVKYEEALALLQQSEEKELEDVIQRAKESGEDLEALRLEILRQYEQRKQKLLSEKDLQKAAMTRKLEARRMAKEHQDYEKRIAHHLLRQAKEQMKQIQDNIEQEKGKQSNALQQKLRERRDARKEAKDIREELDRESSLDTYDDKGRAPSQRSSNETPLPPFGGMRREKTVVDVDISEEQKHALLSQMAQEQRTLQSKISAQQKRQEEMLRRRLELRQGKQKEEAIEVLNLGQKQKTILEKTQQDEKERQLQKMKEKVARQREKREPSPGVPKLKGKPK